MEKEIKTVTLEVTGLELSIITQLIGVMLQGDKAVSNLIAVTNLVNKIEKVAHEFKEAK